MEMSSYRNLVCIPEMAISLPIHTIHPPGRIVFAAGWSGRCLTYKADGEVPNHSQVIVGAVRAVFGGPVPSLSAD